MAKGKKEPTVETPFPCFNTKWHWENGQWTEFYPNGVPAIDNVIFEHKHALWLKYDFAPFDQYPILEIDCNISSENIGYKNSHFLLFWLNKLVETQGYCVYNYVYKNELALGTKPNEAERRATEAQKKLLEEFK